MEFSHLKNGKMRNQQIQVGMNFNYNPIHSKLVII